MLHLSGASGVMIGRAAMGQPWMVGAIARQLAGQPAQPLSNRTKAQAALEHYDGLLSLYGQTVGIRHARKHLAAYVDYHAHPEFFTVAQRQRLLTSHDPQEVIALLGALFDHAPESLAA